MLKSFSACIALCLLLTASARIYGHGHGQHDVQTREGSENHSGRESRSGEALGQISAWLFGIANFPVALGAVMKRWVRSIPKGAGRKKVIENINHKNKQYLMTLHYWLNPLAAGAALAHYISVKSSGTFIPEIGLCLTLLICVMGVMVTLRRTPIGMRKAIYAIHTSPFALGGALALLWIGHAAMD